MSSRRRSSSSSATSTMHVSTRTRDLVRRLAGEAAAGRGAEVEVTLEREYSNMSHFIEDPWIVEAAEEAIRRAGMEPTRAIIRGGTDGSRLSEKGLPCPNLSTGGHDYHSRREWLCVPDMGAAASTIIHLCPGLVRRGRADVGSDGRRSSSSEPGGPALTWLKADLPVEGHLPPLRRGHGLAQLAAARPRRTCAGRSCSWTSGRTPASTGSARSPTCARGPRRTAAQGLVMVGVHTPEFRFEQDVDNVAQAAKDMKVEYPIALDSDYGVWQRLLQPLLAGDLRRGCGGTNPSPPVRRGRLRRVRTGDPAVAARGRTTASTTSWSPSRPRVWRHRPTGRTWNRPRRTSATSRPRTSPRPAACRPAKLAGTPSPRSCGSTSGRSPGTGRSSAGQAC